MKIKHFLLSFLLFPSLSAISQEDHWEAYLAQYEKGVGSTLINMSLRTIAPMKQYPFLLKAGVKLKKCSPDGLFTDAESDVLYSISDKIKTRIDSLEKNMSVGTFTYQCERTDYYYIGDTTHARAVLSAAFRRYLPDYEYIIEIRPDSAWNSYLLFLYPNEETMEYIENSKVVMNLSKAGDDLSKPRQTDHWLYFGTEADREAFVKYALEEKFKVEGKEYREKADLHYQLHLSRTDMVDVGSISAITLKLRRKAKELNGKYDGWETFVIK